MTIYERQDDVGGVWHQNTYPGVACDVPAHAYQFSFAEKTDWSAYYAPGREIAGYLRNVADSYGLRKYIRLSHSVQWARWDGVRDKWVVCVRDDKTGHVAEDEADFVVFATGLLSKPLWPSNIPGRESFAGKLVHSGDWKASGIDSDPAWRWDDKRVGVIGMGASGVQLVPALQRQAKRVVNFGRSKRECVCSESEVLTPPQCGCRLGGGPECSSSSRTRTSRCRATTTSPSRTLRSSAIPRCTASSAPR